MSSFNEIKDYLFQVIYGGTNKTYKFANTLTLNGFLIAKPNVYELGTGQEFIVFTIMQLRPNGKSRFYTCISNATSVKELLLGQEYVAFINILAKVQRGKNKSLQAQVENVEIAYDFPNLEILPPLDFNDYKKKKGFGKNEELEDED